ncbi:YihY/virulence factor BrkB family protein [Pseudolysinimonas kribbensis]|uniref:YihY/virulence factor BrkB family protein n=1 Tax=Pseudolysinimonas kribbensis TaxID=433641 RepID=UPI0031DC4B8C
MARRTRTASQQDRPRGDRPPRPAAAPAKAPGPLMARVHRIVDRVQTWKPVRVFRRYSDRRGALLAAGLSFQAVFAVFAAIWVAFSIAGLALEANPALRNALFDLIGTAVPGLIDRAGSDGAISEKALLSTPALSWTGAIALAGTLFTAVGWLGSARDAVRDLAGLAAPATNFALLKLKDLGLAIAFGAALIVSATLSVFSTAAMDATLDLLDVDRRSLGAILAARAVGLLLMFALDACVLAALYRVLAGVPIPRGPLWQGALLGALALGVLKVLGSSLLGGATRNPLLASFAVIVGLLIWFNLICQVILIAASWVIVTATDRGVPLDPIGERRARNTEVRLRIELERQIRREVEEALPPGVRWFVRRRHRRIEEGADDETGAIPTAPTPSDPRG